jgi:Zn-dependent peptidase ImmA (M78 family)
MKNMERADFKKAEQKALELLEYLGYKKPPVNPIQICEELEIKISFREFNTEETKKIAGFFYAEENSICVNAEDSIPRQFFTIAHELGHKVLHEEWLKSSDYKMLYRTSNQLTDPIEQEANAFAANLLIPKFMIDEYYTYGVDRDDLAKIFCVSKEFLENRIRFLYERS